MRRIATISVVALGLLLVGAAVLYRLRPTLPPGAGVERSYAVPLAEAHRLLAQAGLPPLVFDGESIELEVAASGSAEVSWILKDGGAETMRFTAALQRAGLSAVNAGSTPRAARRLVVCRVVTRGKQQLDVVG